MRVGLSLLALAAVLFVGVPRSEAKPEQAGSYHENARWGYKLRAPKNWKRRAVKLDEKWIGDKFFPAYSLATRNEQNELVRHKPDLWVIGFPHDREKERVTKKKIGEDAWMITIKNPYKDYKDFVKRESWASTGQGGWFYSREERIEHADHIVDVYEIKVEKLVNAPIRVVTWLYHCADVDFAVQVRILDEHYEQSKNAIEACLKSFKQIERTEAFPSDDDDITRTIDKEKMTLDEINAERAERVENRIQREMKNLPKGWKAHKSKHFVAFSQMSKNRYAGYVLNFAESVRSYLDKHFKDLGPAKVPRGVIRVFSSTDEEHAYQQGTRGWWTDEVGEITMTYGGSILSEFSWLADRLTDQYFHIKNENLKWGMPGWIRYGISGHIRWARPSKRRKMVLAPMPHDVIAIRQMIAAKQEMPLREMMTTSTSDYESYGNMAQASSVVYWLLNRATKGKTKGVITTYLQSLETIIKEEDEKWEQAERARSQKAMEDALNQAGEDQKKTDEELEKEEEERFRERRSKRNAYSDRMKGKYEAIRVRALEAAFGHLTDKDWDNLDKRWKKFAND